MQKSHASAKENEKQEAAQQAVDILHEISVILVSLPPYLVAETWPSSCCEPLSPPLPPPISPIFLLTRRRVLLTKPQPALI